MSDILPTMIDTENNCEQVFTPKVPSIEEIAAASKVEQLEYQMAQMPDGFFPTDHLFLPGIYIRKIFMPAGSMLTSMKHKTNHAFVITSGKLRVMDQYSELEYEAPFVGVTEAGTKRVLYIHEDTTWLCFHANPENITDPDEMVEYLTYPNENPLFKKDDPRANSWKKNRYAKERINTMENYTENTLNNFGGELS
jgi:hypothetical protein